MNTADKLAEALRRCEQVIREACEEDPGKWDWAAINADEGAQAREALQRLPAPDWIFLDINLPDDPQHRFFQLASTNSGNRQQAPPHRWHPLQPFPNYCLDTAG